MLWQDYNPSQEIYKVLKQVHPDTELSVAGMGMLMDYVKDCLHRIVECAFELSQCATESNELTSGVVEFFVAAASVDDKVDEIRDPADTKILGENREKKLHSVWVAGAAAAAVGGITSIDTRVIQTGDTRLCLYDFSCMAAYTTSVV